MKYTVIRSSRRTLALEISKTGELIVRAPQLYPISQIELFVEKKKIWIEKNIKKVLTTENITHKNKYTGTEIYEMKQKLMEYLIYRIPEIWHGANLPKYTTIKVTKSERSWGSCSSSNGICFSYRLAEYLDTSNCYQSKKTKFIDAVIVHELAHLREKHHQPSFWKLVYTMMPDYESVTKYQKDLD